jgi:hypothetical protein
MMKAFEKAVEYNLDALNYVVQSKERGIESPLDVPRLYVNVARVSAQ